MKKILYGGKIITKNEVLENKALVFDKKIIDIIDISEIDSFDGEKILFRGFLSPGWIDIHIHGCSGYDTMDGTLEALREISNTLSKKGVTSFLATTMTMEQEKIEAAIKNAREFKKLQLEGKEFGSNLLGIHMEGPFINPEFKGAQDEKNIQKPNSSWVKPYLDIIKMITLAPEMDEDFKMIKSLKDKVLLSAGHTGASFDIAVKAFDAGVTHVTHCFNAMSALHHREPSMVGAALFTPFSVDLITDFIHFHPALLQGVLDLKGVDKCVLITDAIRASFLEEGVYDLGGQEVTVKDGACRLKDGTIAGSVHEMEKALVNTLRESNLPIEKVVQMMSFNPAKLLKIEDKKGSIEVGKDSDLVILNEDLKVEKVFVTGVEQ